MKIFQEKAGVISEGPVWVCLHGPYMYMGNTLESLIEVLNTEWKNDKHLVM